MSRIAATNKKASFWPYVGLCLLWMGTVGISLAGSGAVETAKIKLSAGQLRVVDVAVALPGLLIWMAILFAALSIGRYARIIASSKEGSGFRFVAYGVFALLAGLIAASYLGNLQQLASRHAANPEQVKTICIIITNYVAVVAALATYGLLLRGSELLVRSLGKNLTVAKWRVPIGALFSVLTGVYLWLIYNNPVRQTSANSNIDPTFGLPYWLIVLTVALPFAVSWLIGVLALIGFHRYHTKTSGFVYKLLCKKLVIGMTIFICLTIGLQLLTQMYGLYANATLSSLLVLVALIYLILAYAFMLIAQGAQQLHAIETLPIE